MTKQLIVFLQLLSCTALFAQGPKNEFWERDFWKTKPSIEDVKKTAEAGNSPTELTSNGFDALVYAIRENAPLETIKYLLTLEGNEVTKSTHDGRNYLLWAANRGNLPLVKHLVELGSDTKLVESHGNNQLTFAVAGGNASPELIDYLLANGSTIHDTNHDGANILLIASTGIKDVSELDFYIKKGISLNSTDKKGNNVFTYVARSGNIKVMKQLIEKGVEYKKPNLENETAVSYAAMGSRRNSNSLATFQFLDSLAIPFNLVSKEGNTAFHNIAARHKDPEVVQYFIDKGALVNQVNNEGFTPFLLAARFNNINNMKFLAPLSGNINQANRDGETAVHFAVQRGNVELINWLEEQKADFTVSNKDGQNLLHVVFTNYSERNAAQFPELLALVKKHGLDGKVADAEGNNLMHIAAKKQSEELFREALALQADINQVNNSGMSPLLLAASMSDDTKFLQLLIENGANKKQATEFDETALDLAKENEKLQNTDLSFLK